MCARITNWSLGAFINRWKFCHRTAASPSEFWALLDLCTTSQSSVQSTPVHCRDVFFLSRLPLIFFFLRDLSLILPIFNSGRIFFFFGFHPQEDQKYLFEKSHKDIFIFVRYLCFSRYTGKKLFFKGKNFFLQPILPDSLSCCLFFKIHYTIHYLTWKCHIFMFFHWRINSKRNNHYIPMKNWQKFLF